MTQIWQTAVSDVDTKKISVLDRILIGRSAAMQQLKQVLSVVAPTDAPVMVQGETGVGKELVCEALHKASGRAGDLVAVNCAAIPADLLESELFGHEKGAFTGADQRRIGRIEQAQGGTLFLDEIGDMPLALQAKLLRVLETRRIQRVGGRGEIEVDFRLVTATHRALASDAEAGRFRSDLYFRINVFPVSVPALSQRTDDIPLILEAMIGRLQDRNPNAMPPHFNQGAMRALSAHSWPGNVRELRNMFERAAVLFAGRVVTAEAVQNVLLPSQGMTSVPAEPVSVAPSITIASDEDAIRTILEAEGSVDMRSYLRDIEERLIDAALRKNGGCVSQAARTLRLQRTTLIEKMKKLSITREAVMMN